MIDEMEMLEDAKEYIDEIIEASATAGEESLVYFVYSEAEGYKVVIIRGDFYTKNQSYCFGRLKTREGILNRIQEWKKFEEMTL